MIEIEGKIVQLVENPTLSFSYNFNTDKEGNEKAKITIVFEQEEATYSVTEKSPEYKLYLKEGKESFESFFNNGVYLIINSEVVEYRPSGYKKNGGFCRTEEDIELLAKYIGLKEIQNIRTGSQGLFNEFERNSKNFGLVGSSKGFEIEIPHLKDGGHMVSTNTFKWSAFSSQIESHVSFERLSCLNGMVSRNPLLNTSINIQNEWEENLRIANKALNNKIVNLLETHFSKMAFSPASMTIVETINYHANERLKNPNLDGIGQRTLSNIESITDVETMRRYLNIKYGKIKNFSDKNSVASMLTMFDAWNLVTEMATHTPEYGSSNTKYLNNFANKIVFDNKNKMHISNSKLIAETPSFSWSDAERAFFGE